MNYHALKLGKVLLYLVDNSERRYLTMKIEYILDISLTTAKMSQELIAQAKKVSVHLTPAISADAITVVAIRVYITF